ncbi:hypothetical protein AAF712_002173 [Marasmius tenuissimus]|uniref:Uncharacterized protein n=1 Tax=Marasmius tenuissimus TaxID=585030 RepID=A0ABR3AAF6_9AGAR
MEQDRDVVLEEPFGPYPASLILSDAGLKNQKAIELRSVWLVNADDDQPTGLDITEQNIYKDSAPVHIYGLITIRKPEWLTEAGKQILTQDLKDRDEEEFGYDHQRRRLGLKWIFTGKDRELNVYIQCEKKEPAAFLTADQYKSNLVLYTTIWENAPGTPRYGQIRRTPCVITSLDVQTYERSRNFLERWRLHEFISQTVKSLGKDVPPIERRNVQWLINAMRKRYNRDSQHTRIIFLPEDSDIEEPETGKTKKPRKPCHLSRSECADILATHGEWLISQQIDSARPTRARWFVDLQNLWKFCKEAKEKKKRKKARARTGERSWGREYVARGGTETENFDKIDLERFGRSREQIETIFKTPKPNKKRRMTENVQDPVQSGEDDYDDELDQYQAQYDSDFGASSSEYETEPPVNEDLWRKVPRFCREKPKITDWVYDCPDPRCPWQIDFRKIERYETTGRRKPLSLFSEEIEDEAFAQISAHHVEHMHANGVHLRKVSDWPLKAVLEPYPPPGQEHDGSPRVKEEDDWD